ncbi:MAG: peptidylprolyl isomerase [Ascidiaceihabitans sp.]|jgi:peptidylprolyl isomerase
MLNKFAFALALLASPAVASGIQIEVEGEGANGIITIDLFEDIAPNHAERITTLATDGQYDGVVFHRVIDGFMAQTGDVQYGNMDGDIRLAGRGGSDMGSVDAEFSDIQYDAAGLVGMARSQDVNSANSQFFIMFGPYPSLSGQYTVVGKVTGGQDVVDQIKRGLGPNGAMIGSPDVMKKVTAIK